MLLQPYFGVIATCESHMIIDLNSLMLCTGSIQKSKLALTEDQEKWEVKCQLVRTQTAQAQDEVQLDSCLDNQLVAVCGVDQGLHSSCRQ